MKAISITAALKYSTGSEPHYKASIECWGTGSAYSYDRYQKTGFSIYNFYFKKT